VIILIKFGFELLVIYLLGH